MDFIKLQEQARAEWKKIEDNREPLIFIGMGTCGRTAGAEAVRAELDRLRGDARIVETGCIGVCYAEPLVYIKQPSRPTVVYGEMTTAKVGQVVTRNFRENDPCPDLALGTLGGKVDGIPEFFSLPMLKPQVRVALANCGIIDPAELDHYLARGGFAGLARALAMKPEEVIEEVLSSGLRGRSGGGFPTGQKWKFCRAENAVPKYFICNAHEGDPDTYVDRTLMESDPYAVLEGMLIGAYAIGASRGYVYTDHDYDLAIARMEHAIARMKTSGLLGERVLGSNFSFQVEVWKGAGAFVCGEEGALIASIEGGRGMPLSRPPFPAQKGLFQQPTNINNVETLATVPAILVKGAQWYAQYGVAKSKGTKLFALAGKINRPGLIEVPMGTALRTIIEDIGGGVPNGRQFKAVQTGGPSGGCIPASLLDLPVDYEKMAEAGSSMGSGGMVVLDEDSCMVDVAHFSLTFTEAESCGKCVPCRMGTQHLLKILDEIVAGRGQPEMIEQMQRIGDTMKKTSLCGLGQTVPNPILATLRYFREEYEAHIRDRKCPTRSCPEPIALDPGAGPGMGPAAVKP